MSTRFSTALLFVAAAAGCASNTAAPAGTHAMHGGMHGEMAGMMSKDDCPMALKDVVVSAQDTDAGGALAFTTTGDVAGLRARVAKMAEHHNMMHGGDMAMKHEGMMGDVPASTATAEDIEGGARLVVTPKAAGDVDALRAHMHKHADAMLGGKCPMHDHAAT